MTANDEYILEILESVGLINREQAVLAREAAQKEDKGVIDVLASYDRDGRVTALRVRALDDKEFFQHSDHYVVEAEYRVERV